MFVLMPFRHTHKEKDTLFVKQKLEEINTSQFDEIDLKLYNKFYKTTLRKLEQIKN